jgi:hypothetical protein
VTWGGVLSNSVRLSLGRGQGVFWVRIISVQPKDRDFGGLE